MIMKKLMLVTVWTSFLILPQQVASSSSPRCVESSSRLVAALRSAACDADSSDEEGFRQTVDEGWQPVDPEWPKKIQHASPLPSDDVTLPARYDAVLEENKALREELARLKELAQKEHEELRAELKRLKKLVPKKKQQSPGCVLGAIMDGYVEDLGVAEAVAASLGALGTQDDDK